MANPLPRTSAVPKQIRKIVTVLEKTTRVMEKMSARLDVLSLGLHHTMSRLSKVERALLRKRKVR